MFGRIVVSDGTPIAGAGIFGAKAIGQTDERGFFQIDAAPGTALQLEGPDGLTCRVMLPTVPDGPGFASVGALTCRRGTESIFAGAAMANPLTETRP